MFGLHIQVIRDFFEYENNKISCVGINRDPEFTFGANAMVDHNIVFDLDENRVGLAISKCDHDATGIGLARCRRHKSNSSKIPPPSSNPSIEKAKEKTEDTQNVVDSTELRRSKRQVASSKST